jgi:hypothetical protein
MWSGLIFTHVLLCALAIGIGARVVFDLLVWRLTGERLACFLRISLASSCIILFLRLHELLPSQKIAMIDVYTVGIVVLAWRLFRLRGTWRPIFALLVVTALYLNVVSLSIQCFDFTAVTCGFRPHLFRVLQLVLMIVFGMLGIATATRFSDYSKYWTKRNARNLVKHSIDEKVHAEKGPAQ